MIFLAIALAFFITLTEIRTKYGIKKHIVNGHLLLYFFLNCILAAIVYYILPGVASLLLSEKIALVVKSDNRIRAVIAGFGYALQFHK